MRQRAKVVSSFRDGRSAEEVAFDNLTAEFSTFSPLEQSDQDDRLIKRLQDRVLRDHRESDGSRTSVYMFFNPVGKCLYVGITKNTSGRFVAHAADKPWYPDIAETRFEHYDDRKVAARREMWLVRELRPIHNKHVASPFNKQPVLKLIWDELAVAPEWPILDGYRLPQTSDERDGIVAVSPPAVDANAYDYMVRSQLVREVKKAQRDGRDVKAAEAIIEFVSSIEAPYGAWVEDIYDVVDDYRVVADAGLCLATAEGGPLIRSCGALLTRERYEEAKRRMGVAA